MSTPIGFPAQRTPELLRSLIKDLSDTADDRRIESITGRIADVADHLGGRVREPLELERDLSDIDEYRQIIAIAETRAAATQGSIDTLRDLTNELANQAAVALQNNAANALDALGALARDSLSATVSALNTSIGGRGIFSGDSGDQPALTDPETILAEVQTLLEAGPNPALAADAVRSGFDDPGALFETMLYTGGAGDAPAAEVAEGERVTYQTKADEQVFRDLVRTVAVIAVAFDPDASLDEPTRRAMGEEALGELRNTVDPLNRESARIGVAEARIETVKARHVASETALTRSLNDLSAADPLTAATRLQEVEGQLEILFLTTARLNQLSLSNFLR
ncbi:MAG: hypothetical protein AAGC57_10470 [Pseudomonadota bacterium]